MEKLAILKAWSKVYICVIEQCRDDGGRGVEEGNHHPMLLELVESELDSLVEWWHYALRDWALLSLPAKFQEQVAERSGTFFTADNMEVFDGKKRGL